MFRHGLLNTSFLSHLVSTSEQAGSRLSCNLINLIAKKAQRTFFGLGPFGTGVRGSDFTALALAVPLLPVSTNTLAWGIIEETRN